MIAVAVFIQTIQTTMMVVASFSPGPREYRLVAMAMACVNFVALSALIGAL